MHAPGDQTGRVFRCHGAFPALASPQSAAAAVSATTDRPCQYRRLGGLVAQRSGSTAQGIGFREASIWKSHTMLRAVFFRASLSRASAACRYAREALFSEVSVENALCNCALQTRPVSPHWPPWHKLARDASIISRARRRYVTIHHGWQPLNPTHPSLFKMCDNRNRDHILALRLS